MKEEHKDKKRTAKKHSNKKKENKWTSLTNFAVPIVAILLIVILIYNLSTVFSTGQVVNKKIAVAKELARPGELSIINIGYSGCSDCYDVEPIINQINGLDVNVTSVRQIDFDSSEAKDLVNKYNIDKLPTLIVTGEINKSRSFQSKFSQFGSQTDDAMVVNKQFPPYYDLNEKRVVGKISLTLIQDDSCKYCTSLSPIVSGLKQAGLSIITEESVDVSSDKGKELIDKYRITKVPSLVLDSEASYYTGFDASWNQLGTIEEGIYILRNLAPPYKDLESGEEKGVVHATYLDDTTCEKCYDPAIHKNILPRFGVSFATETTVDVNSPEGKAMLEKYNVDKIPTVILSSGAADYPNLVGVWKQVGDIAEDGTFVFRNLDALGKVIYKNLESGELVNEN